MERLSTFLRCLACIFAILFSGNAIAAGYTCDSYKKYTSCASGYYMVANSTSTTCNTTAVAGNRCIACSSMGSNYTCSGGTACPKLNSVTCSAGNYLPANATSCSSCKAGYKCPSTSKTYNVSSSDQGLTACSGATEYQNSTGQTSCKSVDKGYYKSSNSAQTQCPAGYRDGSGASSQASCTASCAGGTRVATANTACASVSGNVYIGAHTVTYGKTSSAASSCPSSYSITGTANTDHDQKSDCKISCSAGTRVATADATCSAVGSGHYMAAHTVSAGNTSSAAGTCPSGGTSDAGASANTSCYVACSDKAITGGTATKKNAKEYYTGSAYPTCTYNVDCNAGYGAAGNKTTSPTCTQCTAGQYSTGGTNACASCAAGTYNSSAGQSSCSACGKDYYCTGGSNRASCGTGKTTNGTTNATAASACVCSAGYGGTNGTCTACAAGTYKGSAGNTTCTSCPSNSTTSSTGSTAQTQCLCKAGYGGSATTGTGSCTACTAGTYKSSAANTSCTAASAGYYVSGTGQTSQSACGKGTYTDTTGKSSCTSCSGAKYQDGTGQTSCKACPTVESGWTAGTGTGWQSYSSCYETQKPANCSSGEIKKVGASATTWGSASVSSTLSANANAYVNGTACSTCPNDYPKSAGGQISVNKCYKTVTETATCSDEATPSGCASAQRNAAIRNTCNWDSYKDGTGTPCTPKSCTNTLKSVTASSGHYVNGTSCPSCPSGYPNSASGNSGGITTCYSNDKSRAWSGKQNEPTLPTGCSKMTTNACSKPACTYKMYSNSAGNGDGEFHSGCQTNNEACTKTIASVEASAGNYVNGTACPTCTSANSSYPSSDGGAISSGKCYAKKTVTGTCTNAATPVGCASATFSAGTKTSCEWKDYADKTGKVCTPAACTNPVATVTASAGHYVSGTSCPACSGIESGAYPNSDGGTISSNSCYKSVTLTGKQVDGATPTNCASVVEWNTCNPKTCTYKDYYKDTDTPCTPENCTKTVKTVKADAGYYVNGTACAACPDKSYCPGGNYPLSGTQGLNSCPTGVTGSASPRSALGNCYKTCPSKTVTGAKSVTATGNGNVAPTSTTAWNECKYNVDCNSGYGAAGDGTASPTCTQCTAGNYSTGGTAACKACAAGTYNSTDGASSCTDCEADYYCTGGSSRVQCTGNTTTNGATQSTSVTACVCKAGYGGTGGSNACTICPTGKYKAVGNGECSSCPSYSTTSTTGSTAKTACICNAGYSGDASTSTGSCTACLAGTYKASAGNASCTNASAGNYVSGTGQTKQNACDNATQYQDQTGQSSCKNVGTGYYKKDNTAQTQCPTNYQSGAGASAITGCKTSCPAGTRVTVANAACSIIEGNYYMGSHTVNYGSVSGSATVCKTGYTISGKTQQDHDEQTDCKITCAAGNYIATAGAGCATCPAKSFCVGGTKNETETLAAETCPVNYPNSAAGATARTSCYSNDRSRAWNGVQNEPTKPAGCATMATAACSVAACTYSVYSNATGTADGTHRQGCQTNNAACTKSITSVTASAGYYVSGITCPACTNGPTNSTYTSNGGTTNSCPWSCNAKFGQTFDNQCVALCTAGISTLHAGDKVSVQLYDTKHTTPAIVIQNGDKMCYGNLTTGAGTNALNVTYKDATYHTVN